jgi:hypothetical protein
MFCVGIAVTLLFLTLPFAFKMREWKSQRNNQILRWMEQSSHQILFFVPLVMLTLLLNKDLPRVMVTVGWGVEGLFVFIFALRVGMRSYRLSGLALLLLCIGKITYDIVSLNHSATDLAIAALVLGILLGGVSILWSRYREIIREYL